MKKTKAPRAMFIGRWQPMHNGHKWLIDQKLAHGIPVLVAVRDIPPDEKNPFTTQQTVDMLQSVYEGRDVIVMTIPDIESVNYGRGVGYGIIEHVPPDNIGAISATQIRDSIRNNSGDWKEWVDPVIHKDVVNYMAQNRFL